MDIRLGSSLPFSVFLDEPLDASQQRLLDAFGGLDAMLDTLAQELSSIELRTVHDTHTPELVLAAAKRCHAHGLDVTIHGTVKFESTPEAFFAPYLALFASGLQPEYRITVHALPLRVHADLRMRAICALADEKGYPVRFAMENNRRVTSYICGDNDHDIASIVREIAHPRLCTCWDFGHFYYNMVQFAGFPEALPCDEFLDQVGHTHIHSVYNGRTHFPLGTGELPLLEYCQELKARGYDGIFHLELDFPRFAEQIDPREALMGSIRALKEAVQ